MYVPSLELGLPHPFIRKRVCPLPPPGPKGGGGAHSPAAKGVGESQFQRLEKRLVLCLLCGSHSMRDGLSFLKTSALLLLIKSYRIRLLLARSVSLDSNLIDDRKLISLCNLSVYHLVLTHYAEHHNIINCAAKAFYYCPSMISHRPRSQNILKERALNPEKDSRLKRPRSHVSLEKSSQNYKPLEY